jgi:hypothetical protein
MKKILLLSTFFISVANMLLANGKLFSTSIRADFGPSNVRYIQSAGSHYYNALHLDNNINLMKGSLPLTLQPSIGWCRHSYEFNKGVMALINPHISTVNVHYLSLELPICFATGTYNDKKKSGLSFGFGPFIRRAFSGNYCNTQNYPSVKESIVFGEGINDSRSRGDFGLLYKAAIKTNKAIFGIQYNRGYDNIISKDRQDIPPKSYVPNTFTFSKNSAMRTRSFSFFLAIQIL